MNISERRIMKLYKKISFLFTLVLILVCFQTHALADEGVPEQPKLNWAKAVDARSIQISWTSSSDKDGMYLIYRKSNGKPYSIIDAAPTVSSKKNQYTDSSVIPNQKYTYTVCSVPLENMHDCFIGSRYCTWGEGQAQFTIRWDKYKGKHLINYICFVRNGKTTDTLLVDPQKTTLQYSLDETDRENCEFEVYALTTGGWSSYDKQGVTAKTTINSVSVKNPVLVGNKTVKLTWTKSKRATGYYIYRKAGSEKWKKIQTINGEKTLYGYDDSVKKGTGYQYKVKAFVKIGKKTVTSADSNVTKKVKFSSITKNPSKNLYKSGNPYMKGLSSKEIEAVQKTAKKFYQTYITSDMSSVEKLIAAQAYLAATCVYGTGNKSYTAWGALVYKNKQGYHEATCYGYSYALQALCASMGLECKIVRPDSKAYNPNHMWTIVKIQGNWYIVDPQPNANFGIYSYFLLSGKTYVLITGESYDTKVYSCISKKDYPRTQLEKYASGYKVYRVLKKMKLI